MTAERKEMVINHAYTHSLRLFCNDVQEKEGTSVPSDLSGFRKAESPAQETPKVAREFIPPQKWLSDNNEVVTLSMDMSAINTQG